MCIRDSNICELVAQSLGEYEERFAANHLNVIANLPEEGILIRADGRLLWRVLDNLMNNINKYAMPGSRVYADVEKEDHFTRFQLKNISREQLNVRSDEMLERFVRGDSARTSEGSGLGLAIARSLTELMGCLLDTSTDCMTVTGKTVGENIANCPVLNYNVIKPIDEPYRNRGGLAILRGNLAPLGAVVKESAVAPEMLEPSGPAVVFNSEEEASAAIWGKKIKKGDIIVIRYEGPKGGPGMRCV